MSEVFVSWAPSAKLSGVAILFFMLGFATHYFRDWVRPFVLYLIGRTGGCSLAVSRVYRYLETRLPEAEKALKKKSRLLKSECDGLELWETPRGVFWIPATLTSFFFILAEQEIKIYGSGQFAVQAGDIVLDCGANVGVFTAAALSAGAQLVVAIEPVPKKVECLNRNFASEIAAGRVIVYPKGVWHEEAFLEMSLYKDSVLDSFVMKDRDTDSLGQARFPVTTLDILAAELNLPRVDFVKMDVEGANGRALEGARQILVSYKPRIAVATEDLDDDYVTIPALMQKEWPSYRCVRGPCRRQGRFQIVPDVLYFTAP
jgi:FkbM family methyltransferase